MLIQAILTLESLPGVHFSPEWLVLAKFDQVLVGKQSMQGY
jgi:hypothetical protein